MTQEQLDKLETGTTVRHTSYGVCVVGHPAGARHGYLPVLGERKRGVWLCRETANKGLGDPFLEYLPHRIELTN